MLQLISGYFIMILLTLCILFCYELLFFYLKKNEHRLLFSFIFLISQIILTETFLGFLGRLNSTNLFFLNLIPIALITFFLARTKDKSLTKNYLLELKRNIKNLINLATGHEANIVLTALALTTIAWTIFLGVLFPVTDVDGNGYHLPFVAAAIQNQSLLETPSDQPWVYSYPKSAELLQMWTMIFPKNDMIVDLVQIPFLLLAVYSIFKIAIHFNIKKEPAYFSSLLIIFIPIAMNQAKTTYVDIILPSLFFSGLLLTLKNKKNTFDYLVLGLMSGILISTKVTGLLFVFAYSLFLIEDFFKDNNSKNRSQKAFYFCAPIIIIGLSWYIKNLILFQNPIYPFGITFGQKQVIPGRSFNDLLEGMVLPGVPQGYFSRIWYSWTEQRSWWGCLYNYDSNYSGFGPLWFVFLLPAFFIGTIHAFAKKEWRLITLTVSTGLLFLFYPGNYLPRYTLFIVMTGIILFAKLISEYQSKKFLNILYFLIILLTGSTLLSNMFFCNYDPSIIKSQISNFSIVNRGPFHKQYFNPALNYIHDRVQKNELVVYGDGIYHIYPLWNNNLSNKVTYYSATERTAWINKVVNDKPSYIITKKKRSQNNWLHSSPKFELIFKDSEYEIHKIKE